MITLFKYAAIHGFAAGARRAPGRRKSLILRCALIALFAFTCWLPATQAQVSASIRGVVMDARTDRGAPALLLDDADWPSSEPRAISPKPVPHFVSISRRDTDRTGNADMGESRQ